MRQSRKGDLFKAVFGDIANMVRRDCYRVMDNGSNYWSLIRVHDLAKVDTLAAVHSKLGENYFASGTCSLRRREMIDPLLPVVLRELGHK